MVRIDVERPTTSVLGGFDRWNPGNIFQEADPASAAPRRREKVRVNPLESVFVPGPTQSS